MSGAIAMHFGGPISWKADQQEHTLLSSCKAEIKATNMGLHLTVNARNMISHLSSLGYPINNAANLTILYNDNAACVNWCHNMTTKGIFHIENCKNAICKWVANGTIAVQHISGKSNTVNIFTKECMTAPISVGFAMPSCGAPAIISTMHTILHVQPQ
jgi:hypothetical protein